MRERRVICIMLCMRTNQGQSESCTISCSNPKTLNPGTLNPYLVSSQNLRIVKTRPGIKIYRGRNNRPLSSSCLGLPYRILNINHRKELLRAYG